MHTHICAAAQYASHFLHEFVCFSVFFRAPAHCIYHALSQDCMLVYHRKDSLGARTPNDILSGRDECDLHMQVEQIKKD